MDSLPHNNLCVISQPSALYVVYVEPRALGRKNFHDPAVYFSSDTNSVCVCRTIRSASSFTGRCCVIQTNVGLFGFSVHPNDTELDRFGVIFDKRCICGDDGTANTKPGKCADIPFSVL